MQTNARIGLLHHLGGGNLGDEATVKAVADLIKRRWPQAEIIAFTMNPDDTRRRHGIGSYPLRRTSWSIGYKRAQTEWSFKARIKALTRKSRHLFNLLKAASTVIGLPAKTYRELSFLASSRQVMKPFDLLIICGGGQLTEKGGPWAFPYTIYKWATLARSLGVRCIFLNVGAGPLTRPGSRFFVRHALQAADYVSLRDAKSQALLREIGFKGKSRVYPDSAYALEIPTTGEARRSTSQSIVGLAPMPHPDPEPDGHLLEKNQVVYDAVIGKLASFASWLVYRSHALALFGTDFGVDPHAMRDLQRILLSRHQISLRPCDVNDSTRSVKDLLAAISGMDYVVTCRFHGVVFAHLLNKPILAIAHHPKVTELMADLELSNYCVDIRNFDSALLAEKFSSMVSNAEDIKLRMAASLTRNRIQLGSQFDELFRSSMKTESALERTVS